MRQDQNEMKTLAMQVGVSETGQILIAYSDGRKRKYSNLLNAAEAMGVELAATIYGNNSTAAGVGLTEMSTAIAITKRAPEMRALQNTAYEIRSAIYAKPEAPPGGLPSDYI